MPDASIATAADYADSMLVTRRAKSALVLLLLLALLAQLALFFAARYSDVIFKPAAIDPAATSQPVVGLTPPGATMPLQSANRWVDLLHYVVGVSAFVGVTLSIVLWSVLYLLVKIMLVGRLIGVGRVTSALIWCMLLAALLFPWQAFLRDATFTSREFIVPGVLYTWDELLLFARFGTTEWQFATLKWARFVGFPVLAILMLMVIQIKSNRGLKQALGEDELSMLASQAG